MSSNFQGVPKQLIRIADFLLSTNGIKKKTKGTIQGRRSEFFKGKAIFNALMRDTFVKSTKLEAFDEQGAISMIKELLSLGLFVAVVPNKLNQLEMANKQVYDEDLYYTMVYKGSNLKGILIGLGLLILTLVGVMFPLWPSPMRQGVYYLSLVALGLFGLLMCVVVIRFFIYIGTITILGQGGLLFPRLYDDVSVIQSFIPFWAWEVRRVKKKNKSE